MARQLALTMAIAGAIGLSVTAPAKAAGFFDDLARVFGARPTPPAAIGDPFEMTVQPKRQKPRAAATTTKPPEPAVKLDAASDPYWYLNDPTLRKGDIVVTRSGVVVFDGRSTSQHRPAAFTALVDSRKLPRGQQHLLQAAAGGRAYFGGSSTTSAAPAQPAATAVSQLQ